MGSKTTSGTRRIGMHDLPNERAPDQPAAVIETPDAPGGPRVTVTRGVESRQYEVLSGEVESTMPQPVAGGGEQMGIAAAREEPVDDGIRTDFAPQ
jgi:hypothetical protein